jgi:hypothetical protein
VGQLEVGDVGWLAVGQRNLGRLDVDPLHETAVDAGFAEAVTVLRRAAKVRLKGRSQPVVQASSARGEDAGEYDISTVVVLGPYLQAPARRKGASNSGELLGASSLVDVQAEMAEVHRQPRRLGQRREILGQTEVVGYGPLRRSGVVDEVPELVDAGTDARLRQLAGDGEGGAGCVASDVPGRGTPGLPLNEGHRSYGALPAGARGEAEQYGAIS